jgi:hypothetical protein
MWHTSDLRLCVIRPMNLARRLFQTTEAPVLSRLISLLRVIVRGGIANLLVTNVAGDTLASILGTDSAQRIEQQLTHVADLARTHELPLSPSLA